MSSPFKCFKKQDPNTGVGAVIVDNVNRIVSIGYNGMPRGCDDSLSLGQGGDF